MGRLFINLPKKNEVLLFLLKKFLLNSEKFEFRKKENLLNSVD